GTLVVTVHDRKDQPVDGAKVTIHKMGEVAAEDYLGDGASQEIEGMTQGTGAVTFSGLVPGQYWVWPEVQNAFIPPLWVVVPADRVTAVTLSPE
ncbi:MAG TPA: hypothetical protein VFF36_14450, partial [Planctomycetota bacterium]|nr:hypothetical protein [Planctomycetota bacterium]